MASRRGAAHEGKTMPWARIRGLNQAGWQSHRPGYLFHEPRAHPRAGPHFINALVPVSQARRERLGWLRRRHVTRIAKRQDRCYPKCLRAAPDDGPSHLFLERIALFRSAPPQADWDGSGAIPKNDLRAGSEPATWPPAQIDTMSMMARAIAHSGARTPRNSSYSLISRPQGARP